MATVPDTASVPNAPARGECPSQLEMSVGSSIDFQSPLKQNLLRSHAGGPTSASANRRVWVTSLYLSRRRPYYRYPFPCLSRLSPCPESSQTKRRTPIPRRRHWPRCRCPSRGIEARLRARLERHTTRPIGAQCCGCQYGESSMSVGEASAAMQHGQQAETVATLNSPE